MLPSEKIIELKAIVNNALDRSEELWKNTRARVSGRKAELSESNIPGHPTIDNDEYVSDQFIAMVIDMRDSTQHLRTRISPERARVTQMERVYYEVSALLPAMAKVIQDEEGRVTEYLGDGALALFQAPRKDKAKETDAVYSACRAAQNCLDALERVVNPALVERYGLPSIEMGVGLAYSDAVVTRFGLRPNTEVKVIGECIYFATQLSKGRNQILVHEWLDNIWPSGPNGKIRLSRFSGHWDFNAYLLEDLSHRMVA
jgi:class 3 adenylate cyclase